MIELPSKPNSSSQAPWRLARQETSATLATKEADALGIGKKSYFEVSTWSIFVRRFPWLLGLMLVQSISGWIVERFSDLVSKHVVLASFLTMLVGGGGNSSGQTVAELVRMLSTGEVRFRQFPRVFLRELAVGAALGFSLGLCAYPRVRLLSASSSNADAITICLSYAIIVLIANVIGVVVAMTLHLCDAAAVGSPPVVQVVVDVLGVTITMLIAQAILGEND